MQIQIPTKITQFLNHRTVIVTCVFLVLVTFLVASSPQQRPRSEEQQTIPMVQVTGSDIDQLHSARRQFLCVDLHLYVVIDNTVFGLVDSFGEQIVCKVA